MNPKRPIETLILHVRNQKVILDADLAALYGVPAKVFNQATQQGSFSGRFPVSPDRAGVQHHQVRHRGFHIKEATVPYHIRRKRA